MTPIIDPDRLAGTGGPAAPPTSPTASPSSAPSASPGASEAPIVDDPLAPARFAVDLFDVDESNIAPGSPATVEALGDRARSHRPAPAPAASPATATERPTTRDELWVPIVLLVLARAVRRVGALPP